MNGLKHWAWTLLMVAGLLLFCLWIESPSAGSVLFSKWENIELVLLVLAVICILLAVTIFMVCKALTQNRN